MSWSRDDSYLKQVPSLGKQGPSWQSVRRRVVTDLDTNAVLFDDNIQPQLGKSRYVRTLPSHVTHAQTEFFFVPRRPCLSISQTT